MTSSIRIADILKLQIELTNKCNANCPMCSRILHPPLLIKELSVCDFKLFFSKEFISQLKIIQFCGNYGEPTLCKDILNIHEYIYSINTKVKCSITTNGSTRHLSFWTDLGKFYNDIKHTSSFVDFSIDGLEDTNHIYRRNVDWNKLMDNVKAFNSTGALSRWSFIPFKHNQHQYQIIKDNFKYWGFDMFQIKPPRRFDQWNIDHYNYTTNSNLDTVTILPPDNVTVCNALILKDPNVPKLKCNFYKRKELYIDVFGNVYPCCWYGTNSNIFKHNKHSMYMRSLEEILLQDFFQYELKETWSDINSICCKYCWVR